MDLFDGMFHSLSLTQMSNMDWRQKSAGCHSYTPLLTEMKEFRDSQEPMKKLINILSLFC